MGLGIEFDGVNRHMGKPSDMTEEQSYTLPVMIADDLDLPIHNDGLATKYHPCCISLWQFTEEEIAEFNKNGGKVYLKVIGGQPPVCLSSIPFENLDSDKYIKPKQTVA